LWGSSCTRAIASKRSKTALSGITVVFFEATVIFFGVSVVFFEATVVFFVTAVVYFGTTVVFF
jgi:hypothetical protein